MNQTAAIIATATILAATGLWLLLPRGNAGGRVLGGIAALVALILFTSQLPRMADWKADTSMTDWGLADEVSDVVFLALAAVTIVASVATVTFRSPVYCAIWFALSLLGTAGLFLYQGSQFLGAATIVVYAGAILVTFLFVLMLAQPEGHSFYDRISWEPMLSATIGAVLVGILTMSIVGLSFEEGPVARGQRISQADRDQEILANEHMAHLGAQLFSRHLVAVEVAGTLLLVALVGAIAMVAHQRGGSLTPPKERVMSGAPGGPTPAAPPQKGSSDGPRNPQAPVETPSRA